MASSPCDTSSHSQLKWTWIPFTSQVTLHVLPNNITTTYSYLWKVITIPRIICVSPRVHACFISWLCFNTWNIWNTQLCFTVHMYWNSSQNAEAVYATNFKQSNHMMTSVFPSHTLRMYLLFFFVLFFKIKSWTPSWYENVNDIHASSPIESFIEIRLALKQK